MRKQNKRLLSLLLILTMLLGLLLPWGTVFSQGLDGQDVTVAGHVYNGDAEGSALEITLSLEGDSVPVAGQPVTVAAQVYNAGTSGLEDLNALLYLGEAVEPLDTQFIEEIDNGKRETVNFSWTPAAAGMYNLRVVVAEDCEAILAIQVFASRPTTVEEMIAGIEGYLLSLNSGGEGEKPHLAMSLYPFALKAAGLDQGQFDLSADADTYNYKTRLRNDAEYNKNKWLDTLSLADKIFDQIAQGQDPLLDVEELLARQKEDGWFKDIKDDQSGRHNASVQARAILAIDAYYGADPDEEWLNVEEGTAKGRVGAVLALIGEQYPSGSTTNNTGGFFAPTFRSSLSPIMGNFQYSSNTLYGACHALVALSNYTEYPQIIDAQTQETLGNAVKESIALGLDRIAIGTRSFVDSYYLIPALIATDNAQLIDHYELLNVMLNRVQDNGSYKSAPMTSALGIEYDTQQVLIALSDLAAGESAWKRIVTPRAQNVKDVLADRDALELPDSVTETIRLNLPAAGPSGSAIRWYSHQPDVIDQEGMVILPEAGREKVTLTATVSKGEIEKVRDFVITVDSQLKTRNELMLEKAVNAIGEAYGTDLSNAGFKGVFALAATGLNLAEHTFYDVSGHKRGELSQYSPRDYAQIILQLVLTGQNPYNHQGLNYVAELQNLEQQGDFDSMEDNIWALLALDAAGGTYEADLINLIAEGIDENTPLATLAKGLCALASHGELEEVEAAIDQAVNRLKSCQLTGGPQAGMFFADDEQYDFNLHAIVTSGLIAVGEDLSDKGTAENGGRWNQSGQTPLDIFALYQLEDGTFKTNFADPTGTVNFDAVTALADMAAGGNVWSRAYLSYADFQNLLIRAQTIMDQVLDLYTPQSGLLLKDAYEEALAAHIPPGNIKGYGEKYFNLWTAINNLSTEFLPVFEDESQYTAESFEKFKARVTELYKTLGSREGTTEEVAQACEAVAEAYQSLEPVAAGFGSAFFSQGVTPAEPMAPMAMTMAAADIREQAQDLLDKTMAGYHEYYGFDHTDGNYWKVFELASAGMDLAQYEFFDVTTHKNGLFNTYQATDYAAIILQLILTGNNPYDYQGINYVERLQAIDRNNTGVFGPWANHIWALMALDAAGATYHPNLVTTVKNQAAAPGFTLDMRGWALAALQNHKDAIGDEEMQGIVRSFQDCQVQEGPLRSLFVSFDLGQNIMTHGCAVSGLVAAGVDLSAPEWTKDGQNPLDILALHQREDGQIYYKLDVADPDALVGKLPGFNKDAIIALGDIAHGSNVWQRLALKPGHIEEVLQEAATLLEGDLSIYTAASVNALQVASANANTIPPGEVKGYGDRYYRLVGAIKGLDSNLIPEFTNQGEYTAGSFTNFKTAVMDTRQLLEKPCTTATALSQACAGVVTAFENLSTGSGGSGPGGPDDPGGSITVTFTLIGDKLRGSGAEDIKPSQVWIPATTLKLSKGSAVYDAFVMVLEEAGLQWDETQNNYIGGIKAPSKFGGHWLYEFDNGQNSGWLYKVIGENSSLYPQIGLRDWKLKNGDRVIFHYTNDYTKEDLGWGSSGSSGSGGGGKETNVETEIVDGKVIINLADKENGKGIVAAGTLKTLNETRTVVLENRNIKVEFPAQAFLTEEFGSLTAGESSRVELGIQEVTPEERRSILAQVPAGAGSGLIDIGGKIFNFTAEVVDGEDAEVRNRLTAFQEPLKVTLDLADMDIKPGDIAQLCAVRYVTGSDGKVTPVKLGGTYDEGTGLFTFYTDSFSYYGVVKYQGLVKISLGINKLTVKVNWETRYLDVPTALIDNRTMVPLRFVGENLGAEVAWSAEDRTVIMKKDGRTLRLPMDQALPGLDVPPAVQNGRTLVPLRYVAEALDVYVIWLPQERLVNIVQ
ncbi:MAG: stalk domain-containing protein [Peptococcaceae bacterium]